MVRLNMIPFCSVDKVDKIHSCLFFVYYTTTTDSI